MNPRRKISFASVLVWTIVSSVVSSNGRPSDVNDSGLTTLWTPRGVDEDNEPASSAIVDGEAVGNAAGAIVPQVGYLENSTDVSAIGKDPLPIIVANPNGPSSSDSGVGQPAGSGILVPIVSVDDSATSGSSTGVVNHPLVALLPAPSADGQAAPGLPEISSLSVVQAEPAKPENRRSVVVESRDAGRDEKSSEIMDVAEDIVFRPLFAVRQTAGKSPYKSTNYRRNYRPNYRRYSVNGYYRIPNNNYYRSSNNYRSYNDYSDE